MERKNYESMDSINTVSVLIHKCTGDKVCPHKTKTPFTHFSQKSVTKSH